MPRNCNCRGRCSCVIKAGTNVTIEGTGSRETPLIVSASGAGGGSSGWESGDVKWSARVSPSPGWLLADGTPVSRTVYAALWTAMGSPDTGDGNTTFNIPDLTGRTAVGADAEHPLGSSGGAASVVLAAGQIAGHTHTTASGGTHDHRTNHNNSDGSSASTFREGNASGRTVDTSLVINDGAHTHAVNTNRSTPADPVPTMPPYQALNPFVKT